jgi:hypothetical protein
MGLIVYAKRVDSGNVGPFRWYWGRVRGHPDNGDEMINVLNGLAAQASPNLQHTIQREQIALDLPSFAGLNVDEAWETLVERAPIERQFLPAVVK